MILETQTRTLRREEQIDLYNAFTRHLGDLAARTATSTADLDPDAPASKTPFDITVTRTDNRGISVALTREPASSRKRLFEIPEPAATSEGIAGTLDERTTYGKHDYILDHGPIRQHHLGVLALCLEAFAEQPADEHVLAEVASF